MAPSRAFSQANSSPYDWVDPFIGTAADGNTFPGATVPFGMIQWSPDTRPDGWYHYGDKTISGLSLTHISGAGCPIYGDVPILPWTREVKESDDPSQFSSAYAHEKESAHPGFYEVQFDDGAKAELTVAQRAGIAKFEFPSGTSRIVIFNAAGSATINAQHRQKDFSTIEIRGKDHLIGTVHSGGFCGSTDALCPLLRSEVPEAVLVLGHVDGQGIAGFDICLGTQSWRVRFVFTGP